jgi:MFS family permease
MKDRDKAAGHRKGPFGLSRNVFFLGITSFFNDLSSEMVYPLLPTFITQFLGASVFFLGLLEGLGDSIASLLQIFVGWFSDRIRRRKGLVVGGYSVSGLARGALAIVTTPWQALGAWFINRVGKGVRTAPRDALISHSCGDRERGRAFGYHRSMDHSGALLGSALASILLTAFYIGYKTLFAVAFIPAALGVVLLIFGVRDKGQTERCGMQEVPKLKLSLKPFDARFKWLLLAVFVFTLGNSSDAFLLLRASQGSAIPLALLPALWGVLHVVKAGVSIPGGALSDRIGRRRVILAGWIIYVFVYVGFALIVGPGWIWFLFVFYGFYYVTEAVLKAFVADLVDPGLRGTAYGIFNFTISVTVLPASLMMGFMWDAVGPKYGFLVGAGLALIAILIFISTIKDG